MRVQAFDGDLKRVKQCLVVIISLLFDGTWFVRFALMNEVGLSADCATELGRLLDAGPASWQMPSNQVNTPTMSGKHANDEWRLCTP